MAQLTGANRVTVTRVIGELREAEVLTTFQGSAAYFVDIQAFDAALDEYIYAAI